MATPKGAAESPPGWKTDYQRMILFLTICVFLGVLGALGNMFVEKNPQTIRVPSGLTGGRFEWVRVPGGATRAGRTVPRALPPPGRYVQLKR